MLEQYVALDLEMTGLNPKRDQIIEIIAAVIINGVVIRLIAITITMICAF